MSQQLLNSFVSSRRFVLFEVAKVRKFGPCGALNYSCLLDWFHQVSVF